MQGHSHSGLQGRNGCRLGGVSHHVRETPSGCFLEQSPQRLMNDPALFGGTGRGVSGSCLGWYVWAVLPVEAPREVEASDHQ